MLRNLKVRQKLLIFAFVPLLMVLLFFYLSMKDKYQDMLAGQLLSESLTISESLTHLVTGLSNERHYSYLLSKAESKKVKNIQQLLQQQRLDNDQKIINIQQIISNFNQTAKDISSDFMIDFSSLMHELEKKQVIRQKIDTLKGETGASYFNNVILFTIYSLNLLHNLDSQAEIIKHIHLISSLLIFEEAASQEKFIFEQVFSQQHLSSQNFKEINQLISTQDNALWNFYLLANKPLQELLDKNLKQDTVKEVLALREQIFLHPQAPHSPFTLKADPHWPDNFNHRINKLKEIRQQLEAEVRTAVRHVITSNQQTLLIYSIIMLSSLLLTLFLGWRIVARTGYKLAYLTEKVIQYSKPGAKYEAITISGKDELSILAKAFDDMLLERQSFEQGMWQKANFDFLTGLPNRQLFNIKLSDSILRARRLKEEVYLLFLDLDNFKMVNDTRGHNIGDQLLMTVGERLQTSIRKTDTIARLGGDEFVIILAGVNDVVYVEQIITTIIDLIQQPYLLEEKEESNISVSIGVAVYPDDAQDIDDLMKKADTAMYQAKNKGKNTYCFFTESMTQEVNHYVSITQELKQAIVQHEFVLFYQPVIHLETNEIIGAEALIRWQHPEKGLISPDQFINIAEQTGLMTEIGTWVIKEASSQLKKWEAAGLHLHLTINISATQCDESAENLLSVLKNAYECNDIKSDKLNIEITESLFMENTPEKVLMLSSIRKLGIDIYLDDFGTGYSSLSYLKKLPINILKIDRSFVQDMHKDEDNEKLVHAIISMAKGLNLKIVAEGIENQQQLELLKSYQCDYGQGFYFSKAVAIDEFEQLLHIKNG